MHHYAVEDVDWIQFSFKSGQDRPQLSEQKVMYKDASLDTSKQEMCAVMDVMLL